VNKDLYFKTSLTPSHAQPHLPDLILLLFFGVVLLLSFCFYRAARNMQTRSSDANSVSLSVRLSVKRVICDKMEERSVQIFIPYERSFSLVF